MKLSTTLVLMPEDIDLLIAAHAESLGYRVIGKPRFDVECDPRETSSGITRVTCELERIDRPSTGVAAISWDAFRQRCPSPEDGR